MTYQTRRKLVKQRKGVMFPIEDRSIGMGEPILAKGGYKYYGGSTSKWSMKGAVKQAIYNCHRCGQEAKFTAIFEGDGHKQIERFCGACAKVWGPTNLKLKVVS